MGEKYMYMHMYVCVCSIPPSHIQAKPNTPNTHETKAQDSVSTNAVREDANSDTVHVSL